MTSLETLRDNVPGAWRYARSWLIDLADELLQIQGGVPPTQSYVTLTGQAAAPANPSAGDYRLYLTNTGLLRFVDSVGAITTFVDLATTQTITGQKTFSGATVISGNLTASGATITVSGAFSVARTVTNIVTFSSTTASVRLDINGVAASNRSVLFLTNALSRWRIVGADDVAETGANAGSNFAINRFNDAGAIAGTPFYINRASGLATFANDVTITGAAILSSTLAVTGAATFSNNVTISRTAADVSLFIRANAGQIRGLYMQSGASSRWLIQANNTAESGSNAGSNFTIVRYDDAGAAIDVPFVIFRSSGLVQLADGLDVTGEVRGDSFRIDQAPTAETPTPTHTITISVNGVNYKIPCVAA